MGKLWLTALLLLCLPSIIRAQEYRDVVFLKNGSVIKGFYKELYPADSLRMETIDGGILVCAFSDIERIAKERTRIYVVNTQEDNLLAHRRWRPRGYARPASLSGRITDIDIYSHIEEKLQRQFEHAPRLYYMAIGRDDFLYDMNRKYRALLDSHGYRYTYVETDGDHSWENWRKYLVDFLKRM